MNSMLKCKELYIKNSKTLSKYMWLLPIIETLLYLPVLMLCIINVKVYVAGNLNCYVSSLSFILFKYGITKKMMFFVIMGFIPFVLKILSAFFILKKKRSGYLGTMILYLIDFITALVILCTNITPLQEWNTELSIYFFATIWIPPLISVIYYAAYIDDFYPEIQKRPKHVEVFLIAVCTLLVGCVSLVWIDGDKKEAAECEVATLNRCYEYSEKYLYEKLPEDKETLEKMQIDIEEVFSKELFFTAFNQSEYFDRLKEESVSITDIPLEMKSEYANELMYLKCKILLKLDKNEEYIAYYAETRRYFSSTTFYNKHLQRDKEVFSEEDYEVIKNGCIKFLESDAVEYEKVLCIADYGFVNSKYFTDEERKTIGREMREKYIPGYEITSGRLYEDLNEWEVVERSLYMMK